MKKISIIVPIYNGEKYLKKCILSLINQNLKDIEIILINDGSKDKTNEICNELSMRYKNIRYYKIINSGCSFARNLGIKKAEGEYLTFVDADDWIDKDMYLNMYNKAIKEKLDILICGYKKTNLKGEILNEKLPELKNNPQDYIEFKSEWFNSPGNKIYKTSLVKENNIKFLEGCHMGEDMVFNVKAFNHAKEISIIKKSYYNYYVNENSVTRNPEKRIEIYTAIKEIKRIGIKSKKIDECIRYHGILYPFGTIELVKENKGNWKEYYEKYLKEIKYFNQDLSIKSLITLNYRKVRLRFVVLKKYLRRVI